MTEQYSSQSSQFTEHSRPNKILHQPKNLNQNILSTPFKSALIWFIVGLFIFTTTAISWNLIFSPSIHIPELREPALFYSDHVGDNLGRVIREAMKRAKSSIYIEVYSLSDTKVLKLLTECSSRGIKVEIITDRQFVSRLKKRLPSSITVRRASTKRIMHRKIVIIDDQWVWLGSTNLTWESLTIHHNLLMGVHSPALVSILTDPHAPRAARVRTNGGQSFDIWNLPSNDSALTHLQNSIRQAKKSVYVAMYTWTHYDLAKEIVQAADRGVNVRVVIDGSTARGASKPILQYLQRSGINVKVSSGPQLMHHKLLYVDREELYFGSLNWTLGGFEKNEDILIHLPEMTTTQSKFIDSLWSQLWRHSEKSPII